jgi:hypothetical protein
MVVGVYVATAVQDRAKMWEDITTLKFAFKLPMVVLGDFNETLHVHERSSGYLNHSGSTSFHIFLSNCELVEFNLQGHGSRSLGVVPGAASTGLLLLQIFTCSFHLYLSTTTLEGC